MTPIHETGDEMQKWVGLAHVKPCKSNDSLAGALGAFVPVVGLAPTQTDFASLVSALLTEYDCEVIEVEDIEPWEARLKQFDVAEDLVQLAGALTFESPVAFSTFETYRDL